MLPPPRSSAPRSNGWPGLCHHNTFPRRPSPPALPDCPRHRHQRRGTCLRRALSAVAAGFADILDSPSGRCAQLAIIADRIDYHDPGYDRHDGVATFDQVRAAAGASWPVTLTVATAGGGLHLYFAVPAGMTVCSANGAWPGIDVRGPGYRLGGYVAGWLDIALTARRAQRALTGGQVSRARILERRNAAAAAAAAIRRPGISPS